MSRTQGRYEQKTANIDGRIVLSADDFQSVGAAITGLVLNGKGDVSLNVGAGVAAKFICDLSKILFRTGQAPFIQEQFGTAASVAGPTAVANTSDPDATIGPPPQTGILSITVQTGFVPKGVTIKDIVLKYLVSGGDLTTHNIGLSKTVFANNAALAVTDIIASGANGLLKTVQANTYATKVSVAAPVMTVSDLTNLIIEVDATTPGGGAYRLYGADVHVSFNFN